METVGFAALRIIPTTTGLQSQLSTQIRAPMSKVGTDAGKTAGKGFKSSFLQNAKGFAAPLAALAGGAAIIKFFQDGISGASDLAESGNKVSVVFGDASNKILGFAEDAATSLGQTELEARNAAATFGVFGKSAGLSGDDLAGFSTKLTTLSADLASFYNTSPADAITAVGAALRGEAEPIRQYGVLLDDATLRQEALRQGLIKTTSQALTPQQKVLASYAVIMKQTKDAQGDFERTSGGLANQQRILSAQFTELETSVGAKLLPALTHLAVFANNELIPAISATGGVMGDTAEAFRALPGPVQATAVAFGALAVAGKVGIFTTLAAGATRVSSAMVGLRLRTMLAADAFRTARTYSVALDGNLGKINPQLSRTAASMAATRAATVGLGSALKSSLGGAVSALGGPWGIAIAGAAVALTVFAAKSAAAKARHEELESQVKSVVDALDQETGALTKNADAQTRKLLADSGAFDAADKLGISLSVVTKAAEGNAAALANVRAQLDQIPKGDIFDGDGGVTETGAAIATLANQIGITSDGIDAGRQSIEQMNRAKQDDDSTTQRYTANIKLLKDTLYGEQEAADAARRAHDRLADALASSIRGNIGYQQAVHDAFKEAKDGPRTLDITTEAGRKNKAALLDVSDAWNELGDKAKSIPGRYKAVHEQFEKLARSLGASRREADHLADKLLDLPKKTIVVPIKLHVTGTSKGRQMGVALPGFAQGGYVGGSGIGDKQLILADSREFIVKPDSAKYWGPEFLKAINQKRLPPQMAQGGPVGPSGKTSSAGVTVTVGEVRAHNYSDFMQQIQRRARASAASEMPIAGMPG